MKKRTPAPTRNAVARVGAPKARAIDEALESVSVRARPTMLLEKMIARELLNAMDQGADEANVQKTNES
jgi:hypothetical protein